MAKYQRDDTASWDAGQVRQQQTRRKPRRKRRLWLRIPLYLIFVALLSMLMAECGWLLASDLCAFGQGEIVERTVEVTAEDTVSTVAEKLQETGLIKYPWFFRLFARFTKAESKIGIGTYTLNTDMDYQALINGMRNGSGNMTSQTVDVTIQEGYTVAQTIALLAQKGVNTAEALTEAAESADFSYDFISGEPQDLSRLEGYLFPDTYQFYVNHNAKNALDKLLANFNRKLDGWEEELTAAEERGYDLKKILIIASLIEKETDGTDQRKIASVIYNRLDGPGDKAGTYGLLQIDAALLYALPDHTGAITAADLETDSPYNLYKNAGLPPTPIANPGARSIQAALEPETTDYYYYALAKDGKHRFFTNYSEFSAFVTSSEYSGN